MTASLRPSEGSIARAAQEIAIRAIRRALRQRADPTLQLVGTEVLPGDGASRDVITARYHLRRTQSKGAYSLALDNFASSLDVLAVRSSAFDPWPIANGRPRSKNAMLSLEPAGGAWIETTVEVDYAWSTEKFNCLLLPGSFPSLILHDGMTNDPRPCYAFPSANTGFLTAGVRAEHNSPRFITAVMAASDDFSSERAEYGQTMLISRRLIDRASGAERSRIIKLTARIIQFLAAEFDLEPDVVPCIISPMDRAGYELIPHGPWLFARPASFGIGSPGGDPADYVLADYLTGIWWGGGCGIIGAHAVDVEAAITMAFAERWFSHIQGEEQLERIRAYYDRHLKPGRLRGRVWQARGRMNEHRASRWSIQLYNNLKKNPETLANLRELLRTSWGKFVDAQTVRTVLGMR